MRLPAFWLGKRPDDPVILSSYAATLAESKSRQARQVVESTDYANLFASTVTQTDSRSIQHWQIAGRRGGMLAVGVGGPVTGHGAMLGLIDDPFENWAQAQSLTYRDRVWEWYRTTFRTRIWENGAIVLIMTRWSEDDLAGRLLQTQGNEWTVLRLPAMAETAEERDQMNERLNIPTGQSDPLGRNPGEPLCPKRFSLAALQQLRADTGSLAWTAEYQGCPTLPEGNLFKRQWFPIVDESPVEATRVRYWDKAGTSNSGDYSAGVLMARTKEGMFFVEDVVRGQWSALDRDKIMLQTAESDAIKHGNKVAIWFEQEPGSGGRESADASLRLLSGHPVYVETVSGTKDVRARPFAAQAEAGNVRLVRGRWNGEFIEELCAFPSGSHDDQVDAASGAFAKTAKPRPRFLW